MGNSSIKDVVNQLLLSANIQVDGKNPWDIRVHNEDFFTRVTSRGSLGLGESYMDKWWDCEQLDVFFDRILRSKLDTKVKIPFQFYVKIALAKIINFQTKVRAKAVGEKHYDLGNGLFKAMLDPYMQYSCGYWKTATTLEEAQIAKLDLICQKLHLKPGMRLLDIGCGWGGLAKYAAEHYGVSVVGVTISKEQCKLAQQVCKGLPVDIRLQDYRDIRDSFDSIVSVGMFEHVGHSNYSTYFKTAHRLLKDDGLFLLHTIGSNVTMTLPDEWILKYVFPNGALPAISQISKVSEKLFIIEDLHNFGADYDKTLMNWYQNFTGHWDTLKSNYDERFYRMWRYYLLACAGTFRSRSNQLWQFVLSRNGMVGGYKAPR